MKKNTSFTLTIGLLSFFSVCSINQVFAQSNSNRLKDTTEPTYENIDKEFANTSKMVGNLLTITESQDISDDYKEEIVQNAKDFCEQISSEEGANKMVKDELLPLDGSSELISRLMKQYSVIKFCSGDVYYEVIFDDKSNNFDGNTLSKPQDLDTIYEDYPKFAKANTEPTYDEINGSLVALLEYGFETQDPNLSEKDKVEFVNNYRDMCSGFQTVEGAEELYSKKDWTNSEVISLHNAMRFCDGSKYYSITLQKNDEGEPVYEQKMSDEPLEGIDEFSEYNKFALNADVVTQNEPTFDVVYALLVEYLKKYGISNTTPELSNEQKSEALSVVKDVCLASYNYEHSKSFAEEISEKPIDAQMFALVAMNFCEKERFLDISMNDDNQVVFTFSESEGVYLDDAFYNDSVGKFKKTEE
jgi:hypothetical protein